MLLANSAQGEPSDWRATRCGENASPALDRRREQRNEGPDDAAYDLLEVDSRVPAPAQNRSRAHRVDTGRVRSARLHQWSSFDVHALRLTVTDGGGGA